MSSTVSSSVLGDRMSKQFTTNPLVSVVLLSYNYDQFLRESLESIFGQSYQNFELIVIDDGSTDRSPEIIEEYARQYPEKMTILNRQENWGVSSTYNQALRYVSGNIFVGFSSDDVMPPDALEKRARYFREHPDVDMLATDFDVIDAEGAIHTGDAKLDVCPQFRRYFQVDFDNLYSELLQGNFLPDPTITVSLKRIQKHELRYDENCPLLSDWDLWLRMARHYRWAYLPESTVHYRWHGENLSWPQGSPKNEAALNAQRIYILAKALTKNQTPDHRRLILQRLASLCDRSITQDLQPQDTQNAPDEQ